MTRILLALALAVSLVAPVGGIALAVTSANRSTSQETINLPVSPSPAGSAVEFKLFSGEKVHVDRICAIRRHLDAHRNEAVAAARRLPALKREALNSERDYSDFLDRHPEKELASADFEIYEALKTRYEQARAAYNGQIDNYNSLADRVNDDLRVCKR